MFGAWNNANSAATSTHQARRSFFLWLLNTTHIALVRNNVHLIQFRASSVVVRRNIIQQAYRRPNAGFRLLQAREKGKESSGSLVQAAYASQPAISVLDLFAISVGGEVRREGNMCQVSNDYVMTWENSWRRKRWKIHSDCCSIPRITYFKQDQKKTQQQPTKQNLQQSMSTDDDGCGGMWMNFN